ncbi:MAG: hypothetical protein GY807_21895 [Gammaproteobacteria bacterium]|nr:hypothetical protein [Gammaproteobacteria bacterium]
MITYEELNTQNHDITDLSNVLLYLFKDRTMCDTDTCCELFYKYIDAVKQHLDLVDRNLYGKLLAHHDSQIHNTASNFMSGSQEIKKLLSRYTRSWCEKRQHEMKIGSNHQKFLEDSEEMFSLVLDRIQNETERLYPLIREISGDMKHAA